MEEVGQGIFVEKGFCGCNPGVVFTSEGAVLIDTPLPPEEAKMWRGEVEKKGKGLFIINTEHHLDHTIGNFFFSEVPIIAHSLVRQALEEDSLGRIKDALKEIYTRPIILPEDYSLRFPSVTFEGRMTLHIGGLTFEILHLPGHTPGQSCVYIPERKVIFTGDNIFCGVQTFLHQSLPEEWLSSLERIKDMDVEVIVPGHGEVCGKEYVDEQAFFIKEWMEAVRDAVRQGLSLEEAQNVISFLDRYPMDVGLEKIGERVQRMNVERLYNLLRSDHETSDLRD